MCLRGTRAGQFMRARRNRSRPRPPSAASCPPCCESGDSPAGWMLACGTILRPPRRGKYLGTLILMAFAGLAFFIAIMAGSSWIRYAKDAEQPVMDPTFWVFIVPLAADRRRADFVGPDDFAEP